MPGKIEVVDLRDDPGAFLGTRLGRHATVRYLAEYLVRLGVSSVVVEEPYIDRHYLGDFVNYYARSFAAPKTRCERLHFFRDVSVEVLDGHLTRACLKGAEACEAARALNQQYLGFVVHRPLLGAPLGRTVLKTYPVDGRRQYTAVRSYRVHLLNIELVVEGLAFQQQDQGAAVCASTALWSALQKVAHMAGHRTPTPYEVTEAAGSPFPASEGLQMTQMAQALSRLGYSADFFAPGDNHAYFRAKLATYLNSKLPVVLLIEDFGRNAGHAVTVTGYSEPSVTAGVTMPKVPTPVLMRGAAIDVIYVHDDNLGSHAHYELLTPLHQPSSHLRWGKGRSRRSQFEINRIASFAPLILRRGRSDEAQSSYWRPSDWVVMGALVPKPTKLRMPTDTLFRNLVSLRPVITNVLPNIELHYSVRFATGIEYRGTAAEYDLFEPDRREFFQHLALPRFVGIISVQCQGELLLDAVVDVSEVQRDRTSPNLLALVAPGVPRASKSAIWLKQAATKIQEAGLICGN